ncbi:uncharacterized protein LOC124815499 isoform X2 [Hydra vulgaris]|uniref:uncharacterized protein LOC124815499 isoform X2 n=1 Tax=Hydra vulgaris TaxID=6087 RepID=UPI001F5F4C53|nr:uncharacterized protein LOC124815499 isoform X2 [Hydra vulgaris]
MKAVKVTCNGESKIVVATSNDLNAFMANICSTFNVPNISNLKWLGFAVSTSTFPAVICEQSVEMTVEVSSFIDISNSYPLNGFLAHLEDFNNSERNQINSALNTDQHISFNPSLNYQSQSSLKNYSACSTTSLTNISIETESGTELVADSSSCNRPQITKRKVTFYCANCPFISDTYTLIRNHLKLHGNCAAVFCINCFSKFKSLYGYQKRIANCTKENNTFDNNTEPNIIVDQIVYDNVDDLNNDYLGMLALHLQYKYRCSQTVLDVIFSTLKELFTDPIYDVKKLNDSCKKLSSQYYREKYFKNVFSMPTIKIVGKGSVVPLMTMLEFLLLIYLKILKKRYNYYIQV